MAQGLSTERQEEQCGNAAFLAVPARQRGRTFPGVRHTEALSGCVGADRCDDAALPTDRCAFPAADDGGEASDGLVQRDRREGRPEPEGYFSPSATASGEARVGWVCRATKSTLSARRLSCSRSASGAGTSTSS